MILAVIIIVFLALLYILSTIGRVGHEGLSDLRGWAFAHRGLHSDGVPENSMLAFRRAKDAGYGIELDIHLLADGNLAVIHDSSLKRTTGCDGFIEDLSTQQLSQYYLEGTLQTIPPFQDVLNLFNGAAPLIVELKCERNNYALLCETACKMLEEYKGAYCLESFDPRCIYWLKKNRPDLIRGQLSENYFLSKNSKLLWYLKIALSFQMLNFMTLPDFVSYRYRDRKHISNAVCRKLWGVQGVAWTIQNQRDYDKAIKEDWIPIFEGFLP